MKITSQYSSLKIGSTTDLVGVLTQLWPTLLGAGAAVIICVADEKNKYYFLIKTESDQLADKGVSTQCMVTKHYNRHKTNIF